MKKLLLLSPLAAKSFLGGDFYFSLPYLPSLRGRGNDNLGCNKIERSGDEVTARAGLTMFDGFMKAMKIEEIISKHKTVNCLLLKVAESDAIRRWQAHSRFKGTKRREDKTLQKASGLKSIPSNSGTGEWSMSIFRTCFCYCKLVIGYFNIQNDRHYPFEHGRAGFSALCQAVSAQSLF